MIYRFEVFPNPAIVEIHTSVRLTDTRYISWVSDIKTPEDGELYSLIGGTDGVGSGVLSGVTIQPYTVRVGVAACFEREEVAASVWERLKVWLIMSKKVAEDEEFVQKPTIRSDINYHRCAQCTKEQEKMYSDLNLD